MKELNMNRAVFDQLYRDFSADQGLMTVMSQMQARYGISERKAYENADAGIRMVAEYENLSSLLSDDAMDVLDDFLEKARLKDADNWKFTLHRMRFGLMLYQEPELLDRLKEGDSEEALFEEYLRHTENVFMSEPWLEEDIHDRVRNYRIPPKVMRVITRQMEKDDSIMATSAALGEGGQRFKCIAAMDLYLRNKDTMSMAEAVSIACTSVEFQAVAYAVGYGQLVEERARKLLDIAALTFSFCYLGTLIFAPTISSFMLAGLAIAFISDYAASLAGRIVANVTYIKESRAAKALEGMASRLEAEEESAESYWMEEPTVQQEAAVKAEQQTMHSIF